MPMTVAQLQRWARTRQMGRVRYLPTFWVAGWGLATGLLWSVFMASMQGWQQWPHFLVLGILGFPLGGYFPGPWMWNLSERSFHAGHSQRARAVVVERRWG